MAIKYRKGDKYNVIFCPEQEIFNNQMEEDDEIF